MSSKVVKNRWQKMLKKNRGWGLDINRRNYSPIHRDKPKGTQEEMTLAYNQARNYQLVLLDYCDKEELPDDVLAHQRRLFHFARNGPNKNKFMAYGSGKLLQADVLYILSCKSPASLLAKKFGVSKDVVSDIKKGKKAEWADEYRLIRRVRSGLLSRFKKNYKDLYVTVLLDLDGNIVQHFSSPKKAKEYRRTWLIHNQKIRAKEVDSWIKDGKIDDMYIIKETTVIR